MTWYEFFLFLHISMAVIWVGGAFFLQILALRVMGTGDEARKAAFAGDAEVLGMRIFAPSSVLLLLAGVGLVLNGDWSWSEPFIGIGLVIWLISFVAGIAYLGPSSGRIKAEITANGMTPARAGADRQHAPLLAHRARAAVDRRVHDGGQARHLTGRSAQRPTSRSTGA